ncbi:MAG: response regulator, partial [Treponema sp.]|nr:response regulator [Treponema sp.]
MVISDARGNILKANRRFRKLQDLRRKEGQKNSPSSPALSRLARGEIRELSLGGSPGGPGNGDGSRGEEFKFRGRLIGKYPQGKKNNQASWLLFMAEGPEAEEGGEKPLPEGGAGSQRVLEIKSRFLANVSHEIRTPIQTIIGMIELLEDTRLDREQKEYAGQIKFSAEALLCLVRDLLDYSKIEAGKMEREYIDFDLERTIEQAADMVSLEAHKKGLELVLDIPPEAAVTARGDPHKFTRILINLLKNAVKFTREGSVTVAVRLLNCGDGEKLKVTVADTGIGVPPEARGRLFTPFMQADPSTARCFGGTGLGLAISAGLAGLLGGSIGMIPNEGGGSIFSFTLPLEGSPGVPPSKAVPCRETRVLLVDDRPEARHIIVSYLRDIGYMDIETADSGEIALTILGAAASRNRPFELCLVDMIMPGMDGWQLAAEIRRSELLRGTA